MPENTPMKMQWISVDGRQTPLILPQIWDHNLNDWVVTSEQNPLPTHVTGSNVGYSTDTKPDGKEGDSFIELDTKKVFLHDGTDWGEF